MPSPTTLPEILPALRGLQSYATEEGRGAFIRMDFNEGPPPPLDLLTQALTLSASALTLYPEYGPLKRAAANAWRVNRDQLLIVNGADEGISILTRAYTGPDDAVVLPVPTFPMYRIYAEQCGTPLVTVPAKADCSLDLEATVAAIPSGAILSLASPNNPTGRAITEADLRVLLEASGGRPVLVDETYGPYCGQDFSPLLAQYPNLILLRTLSKAYGAPGLRCGFILADPRIISQLEVLRSPFNVNAAAAVVGAQLLSADAGFRARIQGAVEARVALQMELEGLGIATVPSDAHFFLARLGDRATPAAAALREKAILVKDMSKTLPGMLRISVASGSEARAFLDAFQPWWLANKGEPA